MPDLPHGWRMRNSSVELAGPPVEHDGFVARAEDSDDDDDLAEPLDIRPDSEGWEDMEDDTEDVSIQCLICSDTFPTAVKMVQHCKDHHTFDFVQIQKDHELDFLGSVKLVNYIRKAVSNGELNPATNDKAVWAGDEFLAPFLADDALLFSLDDLDESPPGETDNNGKAPESA